MKISENLTCDIFIRGDWVALVIYHGYYCEMMLFELCGFQNLLQQRPKPRWGINITRHNLSNELMLSPLFSLAYLLDFG